MPFKASRRRAVSPPSNGVDDFDLVACSEQMSGMLGARHDATIDLDGDAALRVAGGFEQLRDGAGRGAIVRLAVEK